MRLVFFYTLFFGVLVEIFVMEPVRKSGTTDYLVVKRLDLTLPPDDSTKQNYSTVRNDFLWEHFFNNRDGASFAHITTRDWRPKAREFHQALVTKAKALGLPYAALDKSIQTVLASPVNEKLAVIPVGAYLIRDAGKDAWVIVCNWEDDFSGKKLAPPLLVGEKPRQSLESEDMWLPLAHRRVFVFSVKDNESLAFTTCD